MKIKIILSILLYLVEFLHYAKCFVDLDEFSLIKISDVDSNYCLIQTNKYEINCNNCYIERMKKGYHVKTNNLQIVLLKLYNNGSTLKIPLLINCNIDKTLPDALQYFILSISTDFILIKRHNYLKNGFILFYTDGFTSFFRIIKKPLETYSLLNPQINRINQVCIAVIDDNGEATIYKCHQITINKDINQCKSAPKLTHLKIKLSSTHLVNVKWSMDINRDCPVSQLYINLFEKHNSVCLQQIVLSNQRTISKTTKRRNKECVSVSYIKNELSYGEIILNWHKPTVDCRLYAVTLDGVRHNMKRNDSVIIRNNLSSMAHVNIAAARGSMAHVNIAAARASYEKPLNSAYNIIVELKPGTESINVKWNKGVFKVFNYSVKLYLSDELINSVTVEKQYFNFQNLKQCTKYCITVSASIQGGSLIESAKKCRKTHINGLSFIEWKKMENIYSSKKTLIWKVEPKNCFERFKIIYWLKYGNRKDKRRRYTESTSISLYDLIYCALYNVKVRATTFNSTKVISKMYTFYTGNSISSPKFAILKGTYVANNLIKVNWALKQLKSCDILAIHIKLYYTEKQNCILFINIQPRSLDKRISKNYTKGQCEFIRHIRSDELTNFYLIQYWSEISAYGLLNIITQNGQKFKNFKLDFGFMNVKLGNCFADCYIRTRYKGIRSTDKDGKVCDFRNDTNFCKLIDQKPKCYVKFYLRECSIPNCHELTNKKLSCVEMIKNTSENNYFMGHWKNNVEHISYLVLLYNNKSECLTSIFYNKRKDINFGINIRNFYLSCKLRINRTEGAELKYEFRNLPLIDYIVLIVPIYSEDTIGYLRIVNHNLRTNFSESTPYSMKILCIVIIVVLIVGSISYHLLKYLRKRIKKASYPTVPLGNFADYVLDNSKIFLKQFKKMNKEIKRLEKLPEFSKDIGNLKVNAQKNNFKEYVPYDHSRVKLMDKNSPDDYINASEIPFKNNIDAIEYIAAQSPIPNTLVDFIQMIWDQKIRCIIMLENDDEENFIEYYPRKTSEVIYFGQSFRMILEHQRSRISYNERRLILEHIESQTVQRILHLQMYTWTDDSCVDPDYMGDILLRLYNRDKIAHYLVHCINGSGRTGTFIAIHRIAKELIQGSDDISVYDTVLDLKKYRPMMVETEEQYIFIYNCLATLLKFRAAELEKG